MYADDLPAKCAKEIVTTDQIQHLVAGLSKETEAVQTACKYALIALAKHSCSFDI